MNSNSNEWGLKSGMALAHYVLMDKIADGGMGIVYKAFEPALERFVAIKVLRPEYAAFPDRIEHFHAEAQAVAALQHPNIVPIHYIGQSGLIPFFSMAFVDGRTLDDWIVSGKRLETEESVWFLEQATAALEHAHNAGLIHQDIKPSNFLVDSEPRILLTDFGLARHAGSEADQEVFGTPYYVAPEQLLRLPTDHRTDIYSLGATLFHLVTGHPPFDGETVETIMEQHLKSPFPRDLALHMGIEECLVGCIQKMMERNPIQRFQSYHELKDVLKNLDSFSYISTEAPPETIAVETAPSSVKSAVPIPAAISNALCDLLNPSNKEWMKTKPAMDFQTTKKQIQNAIQFPIHPLKIDRIGPSCKELSDRSEADLEDLVHAAQESQAISHLFQTIAKHLHPDKPSESAEEAIESIGISKARNLALVGFLISHEYPPSSHFNWSSLWHHQIAVGLIAEDLVLSLGIKTTGREFVTGFLHDFGHIVLGELYPIASFSTLRRAHESSRPLIECENEIFGVNHCDVATLWLQKHHLPDEIIDAIQRHELHIDTAKRPILLSAIITADALARQLAIGFEASPAPSDGIWSNIPAMTALWESGRVKNKSKEEFCLEIEARWSHLPGLVIVR